MNPLTPVDPPEVIEINNCPKCGGAHTEFDSDWECGEDGGAVYFVKCTVCGFEGPKRHNKKWAAEVFNEIQENDLIEDCEHCSDEFHVELNTRCAPVHANEQYRTECPCGACSMWSHRKWEVIDNHNSLMELIRGE